MKIRNISGILSVSCLVVIGLVNKPIDVNAQLTKAPDFQFLKYNNPGLTVDLGVGLWAWPIPIDYDEDGDMDLVVSSQGKPFNGVYLFENTSGDKNPVFAKPVLLAKSIKDIQVSFIDGKPRFTVPGAELINFTKTFAKEKKKLFPADSIMKDIKGRNRFNQWKLVDYDHDGDVDIVVGVDDWIDYGWDNAYDKKGNWTNGPLHGYVYLIENQNGNYVNKGRIKAGGKELDVYGAPTPNFADFDGDGDLDLICGEFLDKLTYFENFGTKEKPVYAQGRHLANDAGVIKMDLEMIIPVSVDWDKDGHVDLVVGDEDGRVAFIENTGKVKNGMPQFKSPVYFKQEADNVKFGALVTPFSTDWDGDGDEDIICGNSAGHIAFIENLGGYNGMPRWAAPKLLQSDGKVIRIQAGNNASIQGPAEAKWGYTTLSVADWDGDGPKDLIVNSIWGKVVWYKNTGTKTAPKLAKEQQVNVDWGNSAVPKPTWNWWSPEPKSLVTQWRTTPYAIDWNKDGLTDLVMLDTGGYLSYFERFKKGNELLLKQPKRIFQATDFAGYNGNHKVTDSLAGLIRLNTLKFGASGRRKFTIVDWDLDGKPDILVNSINVSLMKNMGVKNGLVQLKDQGLLAELVLAGHDTSPTTVDWNKDGIPDLLVGAEDGHIYYLPNPEKKK
ncbi:FG-GAP repeat domain-containing protein [Pedobacter nyackensis]|uniref:Repeat domain-containing protein n=1 Tax=Pedobacter nyackensis TaxID=475255 RepID=A0A1W2D2C2_9SPHI|nr:VCBS repeat-containing protein [Pedobacter nyackensis]SMC91286.1 Repeat domain-containing protein [Pedobacter nyackensis]